MHSPGGPLERRYIYPIGAQRQQPSNIGVGAFWPKCGGSGLAHAHARTPISPVETCCRALTPAFLLSILPASASEDVHKGTHKETHMRNITTCLLTVACLGTLVAATGRGEPRGCSFVSLSVASSLIGKAPCPGTKVQHCKDVATDLTCPCDHGDYEADFNDPPQSLAMEIEDTDDPCCEDRPTCGHTHAFSHFCDQ